MQRDSTRLDIRQRTSPNINWAVLGCGHIAKTFMAGINRVDNAHVIACAASDINRSATFAQVHNIETHYGDYASMLAQDTIQVVYIATTHNFHFEHIMLCLRHGKHVLCEKPITLNAVQAKEAFDLARRHNLLLVEAVWTRFLPAIKAMKGLIEKGTIGEIQCVQANFSLNRDLPDTHRLKNPELAGGALLDLGIYPITIADIVFATPPSHITSHCIKTSSGVDQNSFYTLKYSSGAVAQLSAGFKMSGPTYANIMGDKGEIHIPFFLGAKSFTLTLEGQEAKEYLYDFDESDNFAFEIEHVTQVLLCALQSNGASNSSGNGLIDTVVSSDIMSEQTTLRVMSIMDTIREQWGLRYANEHK